MRLVEGKYKVIIVNNKMLIASLNSVTIRYKLQLYSYEE